MFDISFTWTDLYTTILNFQHTINHYVTPFAIDIVIWIPAILYIIRNMPNNLYICKQCVNTLFSKKYVNNVSMSHLRYQINHDQER